MRIALISDLHGNLVALDAVLAQVAERGVDQIVCLGDVATLGPQPVAVLELLEKSGATCILGNHDEFMLDEAQVHSYTKIPCSSTPSLGVGTAWTRALSRSFAPSATPWSCR